MNKTAGGVIAIVVAVSLCLAIFGALAVSSAYADIALSGRMADSISAYYKADAEAQYELEKLDGELQKIFSDNAPTGAASLQKQVESLGYEAVLGDGIVYITFNKYISESQWIEVSVAASPGQSGFETMAYRLVNTGNITDNPYDLWDGEITQN